MAKEKKAAKPRVKKEKATTESRSVVDLSKYKYTAAETKTASGKRRSVDNADRVASMLRGIETKAMVGVAKENGMKFDPGAYKNPGIARMAFGNILRGMIRKGGKVLVDGKTVASL